MAVDLEALLGTAGEAAPPSAPSEAESFASWPTSLESQGPTPSEISTAERRSSGLLGGAPRSRARHPLYNHAWLYVGNHIDRADGHPVDVGRADGNPVDAGLPRLVHYEILRPDTAQAAGAGRRGLSGPNTPAMDRAVSRQLQCLGPFSPMLLDFRIPLGSHWDSLGFP